MVPDAHHRSQTRGRPDDDGQCKRDADDADKGDASRTGTSSDSPGAFLRCDGVVGCLATGFPGFRGCCRFLRLCVTGVCVLVFSFRVARAGLSSRRVRGRNRVRVSFRLVVPAALRPFPGPRWRARPIGRVPAMCGMVVDLGKKVPVAGVAHEVGKFVRIEPGIDAAHVSFFSVGVSVCR